jgi:pimeloyl-ACP methyl ester carboxylesterase
MATSDAGYDEFSVLHENAEEFGLPFDEPPLVERVWVEVGGGRRLSGLAWGSGTPELVLLHGGSQNAHTWDTVALALARPQLALDLPGHGHSDAGAGGSLDLTGNAEDVAAAIRRLAPDARACVGMSLGGLVTLAVAQQFPDLVRSVALVDITPGVTSAKAKAITDFVGGPARFEDFDSILAWTVAHNPQRSLTSLRRGVLHNACQLDDGSWVWRYRRRGEDPVEEDAPGAGFARVAQLWEAVASLRVPLMLVRGMRPQSVVDDEDEAELLRRYPSARVEHVEDAGHSVQGDAPVELARLIADFVA